MATPILLSALLAFLLGWLWYSDKCFGQTFRESIGKSKEEVDQGKSKEEGNQGLIQLSVQMMGWITTAFVYGFFISHGFIVGIQDYLLLSVALWAAYFMPPKAMAVFRGNFSTKLIWIDGSYILASYIMFAFVFAFFV